ncbi:hypothetical protein [Paenibacillus sp. FSL H8-0034]
MKRKVMAIAITFLCCGVPRGMHLLASGSPITGGPSPRLATILAYGEIRA